MGFIKSNACSFSFLITFAKPLMPSKNPEIRHPSIPDSGDDEHRNMPGLILLLLRRLLLLAKNLLCMSFLYVWVVVST
jgi:hypothetical protein